MNIEYVYGVGDRVKTCFDKLGIVEMAAVDDGGKKYYIKTSDGGDWYKENEIVPLGPEYNPTEVYLTESETDKDKDKD